jgi:hypothetical protein
MKYKYERVQIIKVKTLDDIEADMLAKVEEYIIQRNDVTPQWKTASQIASEIGFVEITQVESRAVAKALRKIGIRSKGSNGLKFLV